MVERRTPNREPCVGRHINSLMFLVKPRKRWLRPDMTEKLLTGTLSLNTNKQSNKVAHNMASASELQVLP